MVDGRFGWVRTDFAPVKKVAEMTLPAEKIGS
jgi:hypothetical protein